MKYDGVCRPRNVMQSLYKVLIFLYIYMMNEEPRGSGHQHMDVTELTDVTDVTRSARILYDHSLDGLIVRC